MSSNPLLTPSVSLHYLNIIHNALNRMGHESELLNNALSNKTEDEFYFHRVPVSVLTNAWQEAQSISGDPLIGLHVGQKIHPMDYGLLGQIIMNSDNIQQAIESVFQVEYIINNVFLTDVMITEQHAISRLHCHLYPPEEIRHIVEQDLSGIINVGVFIMNKEYTDDNRPVEVHFRHKAAGPIAEYEKALKCPVRFEQQFDQVIYPLSILTVPTYNPSPRMAALVKEELQHLLQQVEKLDSFSLKVWRHLQSTDQALGLDIDSVAGHFNITTRTLQRYLKAENSSFQEIINQYRGNVAKQLLNQNLGITQVAHNMGFNDSSAFHKAFKRWTGSTPGEYQRSII